MGGNEINRVERHWIRPDRAKPSRMWMWTVAWELPPTQRPVVDCGPFIRRRRCRRRRLYLMRICIQSNTNSGLESVLPLAVRRSVAPNVG